ncbi:MAG: GGDEF domain-containing protein [Oscillospiraceae bacterium]|nr:GGDEF domain-containing protein [Oscillospiraceae bacterium]
MNNKRLHFGVLIATPEDSSQRTVLDGINSFAKAHDINLTVYVGTYQTVDYEYISHYETCFNAIENNTSLDGLICYSGFIATNIGTDNLVKRINEICKKIPVVSICFFAEGVPSVITDNRNGIFHAVDHLIKIHNKRKIVFIMGPKGHPEAEERLRGYKEALLENNIEFNENYLLQGNFTQDGGRNAIIELIENRGIEFDAITASDDGTAMGAMRELKLRGILIPSDAAATGFDDDRGSDTFIPSISTVQQNFFKIGTESIEKLHKIINGSSVDEITYVSPVFLARQSCGCLGNDFKDKEKQDDETPGDSETLLSFVSRRFASVFKDEIPEREIEWWVSALIEKAVEKPFISDDYLSMFDGILIAYSRYSEDYSKWHEIINILTAGFEKFIHDENSRAVLSTLIRVTTLIYDIQIKSEKNVTFALNDFRNNLRRVVSSIVSMFEIKMLADALLKSLPMLSLDFAMVGLYRSQIASDDPVAVRAIEEVVGFDGDKELYVSDDKCTSILYSDYSPIGGFDFNSRQRALMLFPLFFENIEVGILILPYDSRVHVDVYESLRANVSIAVKGAGLLSKIQALSITDELTGLLNRRGFFQFSYSRLQHMRRNSEGIPIVMFMDMDGLKHINDTFGHQEGDIAISVLAKILKETLREEDIIGRMGGDEFVVLSSIKSQNDGITLIKRIRDSLDEYNNKKLHPYKVSASIGSIVLVELTNECFESAVLSADSVMYEEKKEKKKQGISRG